MFSRRAAILLQFATATIIQPPGPRLNIGNNALNRGYELILWIPKAATRSREHTIMSEPIQIHPELQSMPAMKSVSSPWLVGAMNRALQLAAAIKWWKFRDIVTRHRLEGVDGGIFPVWVVRPKDLPAVAPALVYLHGSGFMVKHVPQHIENAVRYAREARCCVLFVDYRLAPKYRFPIPFDDCFSSLAWTVQQAAALGIDTSRIAVGGDSAGGALAASVAQKAISEGISLCGQMLVYPITDFRCETWSSTAFANVPPFRDFSMCAVWETYLGKFPTGPAPEYASPIHGELSGLPPSFVETEQYDPWRDEGNAYAEALIAHGVEVERYQVEGAVHGFDAFAPGASIVETAMSKRIHFLQRIFQ